jgi:hypothetical protein
MRSIAVPAALAVLLAAAGGVFWTIGHAEQKLADAHKQLALLQYTDAGTTSDEVVAEPPMIQRVSGLGAADAKDAHQVKATSDYWEARYAALEPKRDAGGAITERDPEVLLHAANAAFRTSQGESDRNLAMRRLDTVVKTYAEVIKSAGNGANSADAAYNYEYAIRVRDALGKVKGATAKTAAAAKVAEVESDLPAGPTVHGRPGGPPAASSMAQFKIVIPKRGEERKDDPQAGKGGTKVRKG